MGLTAVSLGSVIGSGWLFGTLTAAGYAGAASLVSWALAAFMLAFIALMYAELGAAYPVSAAARYSFLAFGPLGGFAAGWMSWLQAVTIAPIETEVALSYLQPKWPGVFDKTTSLLTGKGVGFAVLFIFFFTLLNLAGLRWMAGFNQVVVWVKAAVPVTVVIALAVTRFHFGNFDAGGGFAPFGFQGIFKAIPGGVVFALIGFEQAVQVGGEARNPQRDLPRAVVASLVIGTLLYLALQAVLIGSLDPHTLTSSASWANPLGAISDYGPFAQLATAAGLGWLATVIYFDAVISPAGKGMLYVSTTSRITYSMGKSRTLPAIFERLDRRGTPWFSVILASAFGVVVFLPFGGWSRLVHFISTATAFMYAFAPVSLAALRRSDRDRWRPYEVPAASVLAPLAFVSANLIVYWGGWPSSVAVQPWPRHRRHPGSRCSHTHTGASAATPRMACGCLGRAVAGRDPGPGRHRPQLRQQCEPRHRVLVGPRSGRPLQPRHLLPGTMAVADARSGGRKRCRRSDGHA